MPGYCAPWPGKTNAVFIMRFLIDPSRACNPQFRELRFNNAIHIVLAELVCNPDSVLNGVRVRAAVANDRDSLHAEQWSSAILGIIETMLELTEGILREDRADFRRKRFLKLLFQH